MPLTHPESRETFSNGRRDQDGHEPRRKELACQVRRKGRQITTRSAAGSRGAGGNPARSWDEWFAAIEKNGPAFLYQERSSQGDESGFSKLAGR
jgi:hypothetical protein